MIGLRRLATKMRFKKYQFLEIETEHNKFVAIFIGRRKGNLEIIPVVHFGTPEAINKDLVKFSLPLSTIKAYNQLSEDRVNDLYYMLGAKHKILNEAIERAFNERAGNRKD
jgi:hypothetical protein